MLNYGIAEISKFKLYQLFMRLLKAAKNLLDHKNTFSYGLIVQYEVKHMSMLYNATLNTLKLPTRIAMHIVYSNYPNEDKIFTNVTSY